MATIDFGKENLRPFESNGVFQNEDGSPASRKGSRRGRSKSIGPGALDEIENMKGDLKDRRKSAFLPATRSILSRNEDAQKAARRRTMGNRRVSFAPEATLHTWDVIELGRDHTTSTDSTDSTRRNSHFAQSSNSGSDEIEEEEEGEEENAPTRPGSGMLQSDLNGPDDLCSSSIASEESDGEGSEESEGIEDDDDDEDGSEDETGTAMSLDIEDNTVRSATGSEESTGSSVRLEAALRQAAQMAGTRGIEYDEYGDMSMEIAGDEITNAFKPWAQNDVNEILGSSSMDQENVNPFSKSTKPSYSQASPNGSDIDDSSMEMTRAVGGIMNDRRTEPLSSPFSDGTMEMTQAVGRITTEKRRRSTTGTDNSDIGSNAQSKRRRSSAARSSVGDDSMDLTLAVGGIHTSDSPTQTRRTRSSIAKSRISDVVSETHEPTGTMDFTRAVGGIRTVTSPCKEDDLDDNEELSMEFTTVLGRIQAEGRSPLVHLDGQVKSPVHSGQSRITKEQPDDAPISFSPVKQLPIDDSKVEVTVDRKSPGRRRSIKSLSPTKAASYTKQRSYDQAKTSPQATGMKIEGILLESPSKSEVSYPDLSSLETVTSVVDILLESPKRQMSLQTPESSVERQIDIQTQQDLQQQQTQSTRGQQRRNTSTASVLTPERIGSHREKRTPVQTTTVMSTPQGEMLMKASPMKQVTPIQSIGKQMTPSPSTPKQTRSRLATPIQTTPKQITPKVRRTPIKQSDANALSASRLNEDLEALQARGQPINKVGLHEFLATAGIRFMDLTTTKRRITTAATPLKTSADVAKADEEITLENSVVAAACTVPELDMYRHACQELKRYTKEGKQMIADVETETSIENPPLIQAYVNASSERRATLDGHMRDMKTNARFRSKEMWYTWRSQLLDELMVGLQKIGEGLIKDDEILRRAEDVLEQMLPNLDERYQGMQREAARLEETANMMTNDEKEEIGSVRESLRAANNELEEKHRVLEDLRREIHEQDSTISDLRKDKTEFSAAIQEANIVREACRGVSLNEVAAMKDSVKDLEDAHGWAITSASRSPSSVTMVYRSQLQLSFRPSAFQQPVDRPNAPIRLSYIADAPSHGKKDLTTSLRFFLQLLRASLQSLPQCSTRIVDLLRLVSEGWDTAMAVAEAERRLSIEALTESRIMGDDRLNIQTAVLLHEVRSKVNVTFGLTASVDEDTMQLQTAVEPNVTVVYGEQYHEENMTKFMREQMGDEFQDWDCAIQEIRTKLIARGVKGVRK